MKRTISECIDLIKQKKESAEQEHEQLYVSFIGKNMPIEKQNLYAKLCGNEEAYIDVLSLLETSHLVEQEKELEMSKKVIDIFKKYLSVELWDMKEYYIANIKDPEYSNYNNCQMYITEEEKKVLEDWLNDRN